MTFLSNLFIDIYVLSELLRWILLCSAALCECDMRHKTRETHGLGTKIKHKHASQIELLASTRVAARCVRPCLLVSVTYNVNHFTMYAYIHAHIAHSKRLILLPFLHVFYSTLIITGGSSLVLGGVFDVSIPSGDLCLVSSSMLLVSPRLDKYTIF